MDIFTMHFPVAGIDLNPFIPPVVGFLISVLTSMGGLSGAFLLLPFQMSVLGFVSPAVSPTNQIFNVIATPSGVYRYIREGRMVFPLAWIVIVGTLPGVIIGAFVRIKWLSDPKQFQLFVAVVLGYMAFRMVQDYLKKRKSKGGNGAEERFNKLVKEHSKKSEIAGEPLPRVKMIRFDIHTVEYDFYGERFTIPVIPMTLVSFFVGIIGGIYGIGGAAIIAPIYVSFFGLPIYTVAGATLLGNFATSIVGVGVYQYLARTSTTDLQIGPDWGLGILFGIGGVVGMYVGARLQKHLPAGFIKWVIISCILFLCGRYVISFFGI